MVKYIILDVDGTLTDGGIYYDNHMNELKRFNSKDGTGIAIAKSLGITIIVLTGRECEATNRRMAELNVDHVYQKVSDKAEFLRAWIVDNKVDKGDIAYIGDDLNDLKAMNMCGFVACPSDAVIEVKKTADYVSSVKGGYGVLTDVLRYYLSENGKWDSIISRFM